MPAAAATLESIKEEWALVKSQDEQKNASFEVKWLTAPIIAIVSLMGHAEAPLLCGAGLQPAQGHREGGRRMER
jgi:hypothetical protein